ncbi:uncharacterized protein DUF3298 [Dysgonomonas alginatilytica]|uniref:Uncharacterized protein DUF3298 n=1 Tax=Dysgonomonas alginatilytica TaxID=1605892 RepID=A0A2V3PSU7_9BACT|nr:RsiV family protein [Dysgonomonas alginatilytica]PXV65518.1 uncharacterized protein DUF3298 [Dysgonomonas alginatilytica]
MKKISLAFLLVIIAITSCKKTQPNAPASEKWKFDKLSLEKRIFLDNDSTKGGIKLSFEFNYPSQIGNDSLLHLIQSQFATAFAGDEYKDLSPQSAFDTLTRRSINESTDIAKLAIRDRSDLSDYYKNVITSVFDTTDITITARTETNEYMGGAHGSQYIAYYNIDTRNGSVIKENKLFKSGTKDKITEYIKEELAKTLNSQGDTITLLEPDAIVPSENFYFDNRGIVYVYNSYEVAPYSDGLVQVSLPYDKIKDMLTSEYLPIMDLKTKKKAE